MSQNYEAINLEQHYSETDPFTPDRYRQFFHYFPTLVENVLDVGCNTGRGGQVLKECNPHLEIIGLDCLQQRLDKIPKNIYSRTICSYSTNIEATDCSFNVVVAGEFIEHIYPHEVFQTLKEFYRIIKPKGRLLLTTPNPNYLKLKLTGGSVLGGAHVSQHYPEELKKELEGIGFENVKIIGSGKVTRFLGDKFPFFNFYGSYLVIGDKN